MTTARPFRRAVRQARLRTAEALREAGAAPDSELDARIEDCLVGVLSVLLLAERAGSLRGDEVDCARLRHIAEAPTPSGERLVEAAAELRQATGLRAPLPSECGTSLPAHIRAHLVEILRDAVRESPELDHLGELHQAFGRRSLEFVSGEPTVTGGDSRRSTGLFYTPTPVVEHIVERTLSALVDESGRDPASLRILDPACGSGTFLCTVLHELVERHRGADTFDGAPQLLHHVLGDQLFGADVDGCALALARWNLRLAALDATDAPLPVEVLEPGDSLVRGDALVFATAREIRELGDAAAMPDEALELRHGLSPDARKPLHWERRFEEVSARPDGPGFDAVVGNPPWVSFGLRDAASIEPERKAYLRERFAGSAQYKLPTYPLFAELGLMLTDSGGRVSLLLPDSFLVGSQFSRLRETLLNRAELEELTLLSGDLWPDATAGRCVVMRARSGDTPEPHSLQVGRATTAAELRASETGDRRSTDELASGPGHRFELLVDDASRQFVRAMREVSVPLGDRLDFYSGCIARHGQDSVRADAPRERWVIRDDGEPVLEDRRARAHWRPLVPAGRFVRPFEVYRPGAVLYFHPDSDIRRRYAKSGFDPSRYERPKLFVRQTGDELIAARDDRGTFCFNNLHVANARSTGVDLSAVSALLNTAPLRSLYRVVSMEGGRSLAQTDIERLRGLPIPAGLEGASDWKRLAGRRRDLGALLADWERRYAAHVDGDSSAGWDVLSLSDLAENRPDLSLRRPGSNRLSGRVTDLEAVAADGGLDLRASVDGETRTALRVETGSGRVASALLLAFRETLRRQWRRRLWGRGRAPEVLAEQLEIRWPRELGFVPDGDLLEAATRAGDIDEALDREACRLYGISPELLARVSRRSDR